MSVFDQIGIDESFADVVASFGSPCVITFRDGGAVDSFVAMGDAPKDLRNTSTGYAESRQAQSTVIRPTDYDGPELKIDDRIVIDAGLDRGTWAVAHVSESPDDNWDDLLIELRSLSPGAMHGAS